MKDFSKEIKAYALKNALEFGKAESGRILPKLFQHGLDKGEIKEVMPKINEIVKEVNSMSEDDRKKYFEKYESYVVEREIADKGLPELDNIKGKPVLRVAPFPSGALHIGNAKTFILNAIYAEKYKGKLILVIDDTIGSEKNPIEKEAYELIKDAFKWLGIKYDKKIVYKS
ncbi:MAG: glutamate--tRNA ligase family protein, partial [Nanoarchaeota archaeon]